MVGGGIQFYRTSCSSGWAWDTLLASKMCQKPTENFWEGFRFPSTPFFLPTDVELKLEMEWPSCNRKCNKRNSKAPPY